MRFATIIAAFAASVAATNTIDFVNQDSTTRTIYFTPSAGYATIANLDLAGLATETVTFPEGWIGNWFSVSQGASVTPGMLGEIAWNGYMGSSYFDVSAIVNPDDHNGVKMLYPKNSKTPLSGCQTFPCSNAYNQPDDIQTLSTTETELVCLVGNKSSSSRRHARSFLHSHAEVAEVAQQ